MTIPFQWDDQFVTGLAHVDEQHEYLVGIINRLSEMILSNTVHLDDVEHFYNQLTDYTHYHFAEEESLMMRSGIASIHFESHVKEHQRFINDITFIYEGIHLDNLEQTDLFLNFLVYWLANHILGRDMDMANQIKAISAGMDPVEAYHLYEREVNGSIKPLLEALNGLFRLVSARNDELRQLNEQLEERVEQRTQKLLESNRRLEELSVTDMLTGLPNRRYAIHVLTKFWDEAIKNDTPMVCIMVDADHLKQINDNYGHDAGDVVLTKLAKTLQDFFRTDDVVCRLGGDEFLVICPATDIDDGMELAETVRQMIAELRVPAGEGLWYGSVSVGVASRTPDMSGYTDLMKEADKAVYKAKHAGKNCVRTTAL